MKNHLLVISFRLGEKFFDLFGKKTIPYKPFKPLPIKVDYDGKIINLNPKNFSQNLRQIEKYWTVKTIMISNNHVVTYPALIKINKLFPTKKLGLIVMDWHLDIYSYQYVGERLTKATIFRNAFDEGLVHYIVFIGIRPSEEACYRKTSYKMAKHNREYSDKLREQGILETHKDKISIIPSYRIKSLSTAVIQAFQILKTKKCSSLYGIDFDLDGFNSSEIFGVEFNRDFPNKIINFMNSRINQEKTPPEAERVDDLMNYVLFLKNQLKEEGVTSKNLSQELIKIRQYIRANKIDLIFRGITEYEPSNDKGETVKVVNQLLKFFASI